MTPACTTCWDAGCWYVVDQRHPLIKYPKWPDGTLRLKRIMCSDCDRIDKFPDRDHE